MFYSLKKKSKILIKEHGSFILYIMFFGPLLWYFLEIASILQNMIKLPREIFPKGIIFGLLWLLIFILINIIIGLIFVILGIFIGDFLLKLYDFLLQKYLPKSVKVFLNLDKGYISKKWARNTIIGRILKFINAKIFSNYKISTMQLQILTLPTSKDWQIFDGIPKLSNINISSKSFYKKGEVIEEVDFNKVCIGLSLDYDCEIINVGMKIGDQIKGGEIFCSVKYHDIIILIIWGFESQVGELTSLFSKFMPTSEKKQEFGPPQIIDPLTGERRLKGRLKPKESH